MRIAVGYVRCSTDMQDDSVDQQKREIQKWADGNDCKIIDWYEDEGKSGVSFEKRPAFMQLIRQVESHPKFEYILVYDESRWGRPNNPRENTYWKVHAERYGVKVRVINSSSKNENDIGSFVTEVVESAEASEYSKKLARSTLRGSIANAQRGYSSGGSAPYGYVRVAVDKETCEKLRILKPGEWLRGNLEKSVWDLGDPLEVTNVKRIFELKASGLGYVAIADIFNREGIPCPKRGRWRTKDQKWSQGTVRAIVTNETYYGVRIYNKHPQSHQKLSHSKERWVNDPSKWVVKEDSHPAIISKELFDKVNTSKSTQFGRGNPQIIKSEYLLSGLMKCSHCGFNFSGHRYYKEKIWYYQDSGYINKGRSVCTSFLIRKEKIEDFIIKSIKENLLSLDIEHKLEEAVEAQIERKGTGKDATIEKLERALNSSQTQIDNLVDAIAQGVNVDTVLDKIRSLEKDRDNLIAEKKRMEDFLPKKDDIKDLSKKIVREIHNFEKVFDSASSFIKKQWIRQFVLGILIDREGNRAICDIMKIPMVNHPLMTTLVPSESSIVDVAGACHVLYGKIPADSGTFENHMKLNNSYFLLTKTIPTLMRTFKPDDIEFRSLIQEIPSIQLGLITEISIN